MTVDCAVICSYRRGHMDQSVFKPLVVAFCVVTIRVFDHSTAQRARVAAQKGKLPEEVRLWNSGTLEDRTPALTKQSGKCSFSSYWLGDAKGKLLAGEARDECYRN